jgi:hypothetical protein
MNEDLATLKTMAKEMLFENKILWEYFVLNQQMRMHIVVCLECKTFKPCKMMAEIAQDVRKKHDEVACHLAGKDKNAKP